MQKAFCLLCLLFPLDEQLCHLSRLITLKCKSWNLSPDKKFIFRLGQHFAGILIWRVGYQTVTVTTDGDRMYPLPKS